MEREKVEIVRQIYDAWGSADFPGPDYFDRNLVLVLRSEFPDTGVIYGMEAVGRWMEAFLAQWERLTMEAEEIRAVGDTVIVSVAQRGTGKASGVEVEDTFFSLFTFRGRKVVRLENVQDETEALRAVGLDDHVEIARQAFQAALRKPKPDFETVNALFHPDHDLVSLMRFRSGPSLRGAEGFREWLKERDEAFGSWEAKLEKSKAIDAERALLVLSFGIQGRQSGVPYEQRMGVVVTVRNGKVIRTETYASPEEALEATGLSEDALTSS
jgi:ketosteroid isomerase-like protein